MSDSENGVGGFGWFLAGLGVGALVGVLYAPKAGSDTRDDLLAASLEAKDKAAALAQQGRDRAADLAQQGKQQGMTPARLGDVEEVAHLESRSLGGELAELGTGDAVQRLVVLDLAAQPLKTLDPQADRL